MGVSAYSARELAASPGRRGRISYRLYRSLSHSSDLPVVIYIWFTSRLGISGLGRQSRDLLDDLAQASIGAWLRASTIQQKGSKRTGTTEQTRKRAEEGVTGKIRTYRA